MFGCYSVGDPAGNGVSRLTRALVEQDLLFSAIQISVCRRQTAGLGRGESRENGGLMEVHTLKAVIMGWSL